MTDRIDATRPPFGAATRRAVRAALVLVLLLALPFIAIAGWFWYQVDPPGSPGRVVSVAIPKGAGVSAIADRLEARGVIGSAFAFRIYAQISGAPSIQAGEYRLHRGLGASAAIDALTRWTAPALREARAPTRTHLR